MIIFAVLLGSLAGILLARRHIDHLLILFYHFKYKNRYEQLFDQFDTDNVFKLIKDVRFKTYHEFLLRHQAAKPEAKKIFMEHWSAICALLVRNYLIFVVFPAILFTGNWFYFVAPVLCFHLGYLIHRRLVKHNDISFYGILLYQVIVNEVAKSKSHEK